MANYILQLYIPSRTYVVVEEETAVINNNSREYKPQILGK